MSQVPPCLSPAAEDVQKMLACQVHLGASSCNPEMFRYVWKRRNDGPYILNLAKTWEKLVLAARVIVAIENPQDICVISARPYGQRAVLKFAGFTGVQAISGRYTPGTFTNQIQDKFIEPRLLVVTDPQVDHQPIREASYVNLPTIAFANTDANLRYVDIAIPANNKTRHSIGLLWWMLAREVLHLRGTISRTTPWDVMVDLFFYRDPDTEQEKNDELALEDNRLDSAQADSNAESWPAEGASWDSGAQALEWGAGAGQATDWNNVEPQNAGLAGATWETGVATNTSWEPTAAAQESF